MESVYKISRISGKYIILKNRFSPRLLVYTRQFCSKDEANNSSINSEDGSIKKQETKCDEESSAKSNVLSQETDQSSSDKKKEEAKQKLKALLSEVEVLSDYPKRTSSLSLSKPLKRISKKKRIEEMEMKLMTPKKEMKMAIKAVASNFNEDHEKVEIELTEKLNSLNIINEPAIEETEKADHTDSRIDNEVNQKIMSSVQEVAETLSEKPIPPRSELVQRLLRHSLNKNNQAEVAKSVRSVIEGMKLQQEQAGQEKERRMPVVKPMIGGLKLERKQADQEMQMMERRMPVVKSVTYRKVDLFGAPPLNIFNQDAEVKPDSSNMFWKKLEEKQLHLLTQFAPANAFEEMIMWTEQGKHWKFPIDNETEMGAEEKVGFHEHVFLDHHLKGFPRKGPVRHFMELVVVGLSKNPYITVERKLESIEWFRTYFKEKDGVLRQTGAIE